MCNLTWLSDVAAAGCQKLMVMTLVLLNCPAVLLEGPLSLTCMAAAHHGCHGAAGLWDTRVRIQQRWDQVMVLHVSSKSQVFVLKSRVNMVETGKS